MEIKQHIARCLNCMGGKLTLIRYILLPFIEIRGEHFQSHSGASVCWATMHRIEGTWVAEKQNPCYCIFHVQSRHNLVIENNNVRSTDIRFIYKLMRTTNMFILVNVIGHKYRTSSRVENRENWKITCKWSQNRWTSFRKVLADFSRLWNFCSWSSNNSSLVWKGKQTSWDPLTNENSSRCSCNGIHTAA